MSKDVNFLCGFVTRKKEYASSALLRQPNYRFDFDLHAEKGELADLGSPALMPRRNSSHGIDVLPILDVRQINSHFEHAAELRFPGKGIEVTVRSACLRSSHDRWP
jgi:hypothetical protein